MKLLEKGDLGSKMSLFLLREFYSQKIENSLRELDAKQIHEVKVLLFGSKNNLQ